MRADRENTIDALERAVVATADRSRLATRFVKTFEPAKGAKIAGRAGAIEMNERALLAGCRPFSLRCTGIDYLAGES